MNSESNGFTTFTFGDLLGGDVSGAISGILYWTWGKGYEINVQTETRSRFTIQKDLANYKLSAFRNQGSSNRHKNESIVSSYNCVDGESDDVIHTATASLRNAIEKISHINLLDTMKNAPPAVARSIAKAVSGFVGFLIGLGLTERQAPGFL